jgi:hypothetical protein
MDGKRIRCGDRVEMMPGWRRTGLVTGAAFTGAARARLAGSGPPDAGTWAGSPRTGRPAGSGGSLTQTALFAVQRGGFWSSAS